MNIWLSSKNDVDHLAERVRAFSLMFVKPPSLALCKSTWTTYNTIIEVWSTTRYQRQSLSSNLALLSRARWLNKNFTAKSCAAQAWPPDWTAALQKFLTQIVKVLWLANIGKSSWAAAFWLAIAFIFQLFFARFIAEGVALPWRIYLCCSRAPEATTYCNNLGFNNDQQLGIDEGKTEEISELVASWQIFMDFVSLCDVCMELAFEHVVFPRGWSSSFF